MTTVADKLHKWSLQELNLVSEGGLNRIPNVETFQILTKGRNKRIWNYVINHVRSKATVDKVKRTLYLKRKLKEQQENVVCLINNSMDHEKLQDSLSKGTEKRKYLMRSLSTIEERIINLDQSIQKIKDEIFQTNQKTALLEHLKQLYDEKNSHLKKLISNISPYQCALNAYQTSKVFDKMVTDFSYDFLFENKAVYDKNLLMMKDLVIISSNIFKKQFNQEEENMHILKENFQKNFIDLKARNLLIDFIILLKEMNRSDVQQFTTLNSQNLSIKEFILKNSKGSQANEKFAHLKCDYIYNSLSDKKNKDKINDYSTLISKEREKAKKTLEIHHMDFDNEIRLVLIEKQAENEALFCSNKYLENYLENIANKTEKILKNIRLKKLHSNDIDLIKQLFYKDADLTFNLLYTTLSTIQKVTICLKDLKLFACKELFKIPFPEGNSVAQLKENFSSEKKQTWEYCTKTKLIESFFTESSVDKELPVELCQSLNIQPYQNISVLCENWACFKQKLYAEIAANTKACMPQNYINVSEVYLKIFKMLEKMKFSIEKGMLSLTYGGACCQKNKSLIHEWWNQNAQYIPHIEYEGKTLKMWIDILTVLSDFQLQSHL